MPSSDINSLFQWGRGPTTVGLQLAHRTDNATVFGANAQMAARRIPC
jgi:hypothetical protein